MQSCFALFVSLALLLNPSVTLRAEPTPATQPASRPTQVLLTVLHTNDPHGRVHLPGKPQGLSKVATLVRQVRKEMPHVLLLDAGDIIHGTPVEKAFGGEPVIAAMSAMGYDASAAGNHEFDMGQRVARKAWERATFPFLSANVLDTQTGKPWANLKPYIVREVDGVRVAIFGLTTPGTVQIQWPRTIAGITFADFIPIATELVPHLRTQERADVVIALTHLGVRDDKKLAAAVPGIDVILGGHSHTRLNEQVWESGTLITQTGAHAVTLGRVDLLIGQPERAGGKRPVTINGREGRWWGHDGVPKPLPSQRGEHEFPNAPLIPLTEAIADDPAVVAAYRPFAKKVLPGLEEVLTEAIEPLPALHATRREVAVGQLLADAVRAHAKSDVALASSGQINARGLLAGPVRVSDLYDLLGAYTRQHIVVLRAPGVLLRGVAARLIDGEQLPVHISGFQVAGESIAIGDQPLDDAQTYTISGPAHVLQDYFLGQKGVEILQDDAEAPHLRDAAIEFLRDHPPLRNTVEKRISR